MTIQTLSLPELVDLALCTPIMGVVNFQILRTILHILIKKLGLEKFCAKVNLNDMQPQQLQMPDSPRRPSEIERTISIDFSDNAESENFNYVDSSDVMSGRTSLQKDTRQSTKTSIYRHSGNNIEQDSKTINELFDLESSRESSEISLKDKKLFQDDIAEFWKKTSVNSRVTALEGGLEKIVDIIDDHVRDFQHFKKDAEKRRKKDNDSSKLLHLNFEELCQSQNEIIEKVQKFVVKENFEELQNAHIKTTNELFELIHSADERFKKFSEKLEGDYKITDILFDISEIRGILKIPRKKPKSSTLSPICDDKADSNVTAEKQLTTEDRTEFEEFRTRLDNIDERIEKVEESNREMLRNREEETMAYEEKMAEKEEIINKLITYMTESKGKIDNVQELLTTFDERIHKLKEAVVDIAKIQDDMAEEGDKNVKEIDQKLEEMFIELKKLSMLQEFQIHLEDIKMNKADRSEMLDGLDRKCDRTQLEDKIDKTIFGSYCEKISFNIENLETKLVDLKENIEKSFKDFITLLDHKFEKKEMNIFQENFKEQLKSIVTKLRFLMKTVEEGPFAAGIKIRCISCDSPVQRPRNLIINDTNVDKKISIFPQDQRKFLPPISCAEINCSAGGSHTLSSPLYINKFKDIMSQPEKQWKEVVLQGIDGRTYRGYIEKIQEILFQ